MLPARSEYERFIYSISKTFPIVEKSTLHFFSTSAAAGMLTGTIWFRNGLRLKVVEVIDFAARQILDYSYTVYEGQHKVTWYDPQPHPEDPNLVETFPHHKHVPPNIKKNRKSSADISFDNLNLPTLIEEIGSFSSLSFSENL